MANGICAHCEREQISEGKLQVQRQEKSNRRCLRRETCLQQQVLRAETCWHQRFSSAKIWALQPWLSENCLWIRLQIQRGRWGWEQEVGALHQEGVQQDYSRVWCQRRGSEIRGDQWIQALASQSLAQWVRWGTGWWGSRYESVVHVQ